MKTIALFSLLFLSSCATQTDKICKAIDKRLKADRACEGVWRKDRGSNLTIFFFGPNEGIVTRADKGYKVGQFSRQWERADDKSVWTEPDWNRKKIIP